jgi:hypothetical protein
MTGKDNHEDALIDDLVKMLSDPRARGVKLQNPLTGEIMTFKGDDPQERLEWIMEQFTKIAPQ